MHQLIKHMIFHYREMNKEIWYLLMKFFSEAVG